MPTFLEDRNFNRQDALPFKMNIMFKFLNMYLLFEG